MSGAGLSRCYHTCADARSAGAFHRRFASPGGQRGSPSPPRFRPLRRLPAQHVLRHRHGRLLGPLPAWTSPRGLQGSLSNPSTSGGPDGGEANPAPVHGGVQGAGGQALAGRQSRAVGGGDRTRVEHRAAQHVAHRAPRSRVGRSFGREEGRGGRDASAQAGEQAAGGGADPAQGGSFFARRIA